MIPRHYIAGKELVKITDHKQQMCGCQPLVQRLHKVGDPPNFWKMQPQDLWPFLTTQTKIKASSSFTCLCGIHIFQITIQRWHDQHTTLTAKFIRYTWKCKKYIPADVTLPVFSLSSWRWYQKLNITVKYWKLEDDLVCLKYKMTEPRIFTLTKWHYITTTMTI